MERRIAWSCLFFFTLAGHAEECATTYLELNKTERLQTVKTVFPPDARVGFVNETKGSYVVLESVDDKLSISFYTSGLFDLYPVKREGPLKFCDDGKELKMIGLGRSDALTIVDGKMTLGKASPKRNFVSGEMPEPLKKLHKIVVRGLASEH